ncbi:hypothetical protein AB0J55_06290 [Amycolatopsis sp. NPDC049688]|uniref:hypothetical protein n=1 Tax=Amycolatopsis sp. NPDC049688 TaxID=3154733 RepID=UPI00341DECA1
MSERSRYYKAGVREALFMLSRGRCYAPKCSQRVLRIVDDDPSINIQIAHINGLKPGSARFDPTIPVKTLNSFGNLLLLCQSHHRPVDDKAKEDKYPKKLLLNWKKDREVGAYSQLAGLDILGKDELEAMLVSAVVDTKDEILEAIDEVAMISKSTAATLRDLVKESFDSPYLDLDAVALLADSAASLRHLPDSAAILNDAAGRLRDLADSAATLNDAASKLSNAADNAGMLHSAASNLSSAFTSAMNNDTAYEIRQVKSEVEAASQQLSQVVEEINEATRYASQAEYGNTIIEQVDDGRNWLYFKWGLGTGAVAVTVLAILITIMIVQSKGG